jgi:hypothetical protein
MVLYVFYMVFVFYNNTTLDTTTISFQMEVVFPLYHPLHTGVYLGSDVLHAETHTAML